MEFVNSKTCNIVKVSSPLLDILKFWEITNRLILISCYLSFSNNYISLDNLNMVKTSVNTVKR